MHAHCVCITFWLHRIFRLSLAAWSFFDTLPLSPDAFREARLRRESQCVPRDFFGRPLFLFLAWLLLPPPLFFPGGALAGVDKPSPSTLVLDPLSSLSVDPRPPAPAAS